MNFDRAFNKLLGNEGGYVNHPDDPGGETNWGITKRVALENGYTGEMIEMPLSVAKEIYKNNYWDRNYNILPFSVAFNLFDAAVNHGQRTAVKLMQRALHLKVDGIMGTETTHAILYNDEYKVVCLFNAERLNYYTGLTRSWQTFGRGWANRVAENLRG